MIAFAEIDSRPRNCSGALGPRRGLMDALGLSQSVAHGRLDAPILLRSALHELQLAVTALPLPLGVSSLV